MASTQRLQLGVQLPGLWYGHVWSREQASRGRATVRIRPTHAAVDRLTNHGGHRDATFARHCCDALMALIVEKDL